MQALHRPAWLTVREFEKSDLGKRACTLVDILSSYLLLLPVMFHCSEVLLIMHFQIWNLPSTLSKRLSTQASSLLYFTKCIHFSVPPCGAGEMAFSASKWRQPASFLVNETALPMTSCGLYCNHLLCIQCAAAALYLKYIQLAFIVPTDPYLLSSTASILDCFDISKYRTCIIFSISVQCPFIQWELEVT